MNRLHPFPSAAAHYPCQPGPGPTWHSLADLIELDIPACLGIVRWHENLTAMAAQTGGEGGFGGTCRVDLRLDGY